MQVTLSVYIIIKKKSEERYDVLPEPLVVQLNLLNVVLRERLNWILVPAFLTYSAQDDMVLLNSNSLCKNEQGESLRTCTPDPGVFWPNSSVFNLNNCRAAF